jgi:hypothetical protein
VPAALLVALGKLALGLEPHEHELLQSWADAGLDRVLLHRAQRHEHKQFDLVRLGFVQFGFIGRARWFWLDRPWLLGKLNGLTRCRNAESSVIAAR